MGNRKQGNMQGDENASSCDVAVGDTTKKQNNKHCDCFSLCPSLCSKSGCPRSRASSGVKRVRGREGPSCSGHIWSTDKDNLVLLPQTL